ncbi:formate dehydrogenase subunit gamma [Virgisporangium aliadipatigenens]|uniref:Formate dehydrogenase subunit gamma n=1 Tax=Virgisporangium aliadipatigenens TaxID=741659 RepID=A0A8J4DPZ7_9ACTN|nr:NAD(P)H-dependent oxidoreductase subunit E [Virgisporangium aliadipatigenens]GIJ45431.1 formate dehydrogenase subunit gamma [Virgisporangium aliadipatigenens]
MRIEEVEAAVRKAVAEHRDDRGPLLPVLHAVHAALGHVPESAIPLLARELNLSRADVHGVVTFYHDFRRTAPERRVVRICRAEACQAVGAAALVEQAGALPDILAEQVFCLGNCALGPSVQIDGKTHGRVDGPRLRAILEETR